MLTKKFRNWNFYTLLRYVKNIATEKYCQIPIKLNINIAYNSAFLLERYPREMKTSPYKNMYVISTIFRIAKCPRLISVSVRKM